jgi:hypothetical protein
MRDEIKYRVLSYSKEQNHLYTHTNESLSPIELLVPLGI